MDSPFLGMIGLFGFNFAPRGWMICAGQLLSISQYSALYSLLGTTYGGDGRNTFGLPDLRSRVPLGMGQAPGLSNYAWGQKSGNETNTMTISNLPSHSHLMMGSGDAQTVGTPAGNSLGTAGRGATSGLIYSAGNGNPVAMGSATSPTGNGVPMNNIQPILAMNYCIAVVGIFPSRN